MVGLTKESNMSIGTNHMQLPPATLWASQTSPLKRLPITFTTIPATPKALSKMRRTGLL